MWVALGQRNAMLQAVKAGDLKKSCHSAGVDPNMGGRGLHCGNMGYEKLWSKVSLKLVKRPFYNSKTAIFGIRPKNFSRSVINLILLKLAALNSSFYTYMVYLRKP